MNKISSFWEEVKRRNIVRKNTVYLATAYVVLEFISIISEPLGLPGWTLKFALVFLSVGFIVSLILSWTYNISSEGLKKTEAAVPAEGPELSPSKPVKSVKPAKRKLKGSDVVIAALAIMVAVLAYPRIFKGGGNLQAMTRTISVINEFGEKEIHEVYMDDYLTTLAIFSYTNDSQDSSLNWLEIGIFAGVAEDLDQFNYFSVDWNGAEKKLYEQIKAAKSKNIDRFLTGSFKLEDGFYEITSRIHQTENGSILTERIHRGSDLFSLLDSISLQVRIDLGISEEILSSAVDLPFKVHQTDKPEAYKQLVLAFSGGPLWKHLDKAVGIDSSYAYALYNRALFNHTFQVNKGSAANDISQAMRHRQRMPENREIQTRILYYSILGDSEKAIALAEMQYELKPSNVDLLDELIDVYLTNFKIQESIQALLKLNELVPDLPANQIRLAESYLFNDELNEGIELLEKVLATNPENTNALQLLSQFYLHKNDLDEAESILRKAILFNPEEEAYWSKIQAHFALAKNTNVDKKLLESCTGQFRYEDGELRLLAFTHNNRLLMKGENQTSMFLYRISGSVFISYDGFFEETFLRNEHNLISKISSKQRNLDEASIVWKQDDLIRAAANLLTEGKTSEALPAFREAYERYPDHEYLGHYIKHLEFIESQDYQNMEAVFDSYMGSYKDIQLYAEGEHMYFKEVQGFYKVLPLSENRFMVPGKYNLLVQVIKEQDEISRLKFAWTDGKEKLYERSN